MISRRGVLGGLGTAGVGCLAGCSFLSEPPAGSVEVTNDDDLPHSLSVWVGDVGDTEGDDFGEVEGTVDVPEEQRHQTLSVHLSPGDQHTYRSVFTEAVYYELNVRIDGHLPQTLGPDGKQAFKPVSRTGKSGWYLRFRVDTGGELIPGLSSTSNEGTFDFQ